MKYHFFVNLSRDGKTAIIQSRGKGRNGGQLCTFWNKTQIISHSFIRKITAILH